ncbi:MAG: DegT/DnrJ/EryC1/StrS family aminotransferase [Hyphomicrobiales bacterium]|nr:DegT/DnrJ/EryC1/StrS family aminotransferase [Hyphomicrobiales bacterium]
MIVAEQRIPVAAPSITDREVACVADAARTAWGPGHYAYNAKFERALADYVGVKHAISVPHATAALHLALAALGIGPGDEVIAPDVTWIASVAPIVQLGATPVLVDVDPVTWCIDPGAVETAMGPRTKAVIGVDLYGSTCDWERLEGVAARRGIALVEDAAEALGSERRGRRAGSFGRASAFSFHGSKTVVTGEGGMLATDDDVLFSRAQFLRDHGRAPGDRFFLNSEIAFKYKMSALQAALGAAQMERIDELVGMKRAIFGWYRERLADLDGIVLNAEPPDTFNSYWMTTVVLDPALGLDKFAVMAGLDRRNIDSRPFFSRLSTLPAFADRPESTRFVTPRDKGARAAEYGVNLPSGYDMTEAKADVVCGALREIVFARV